MTIVGSRGEDRTEEETTRTGLEMWRTGQDQR
jgi:hypothetical protein